MLGCITTSGLCSAELAKQPVVCRHLRQPVVSTVGCCRLHLASRLQWAAFAVQPVGCIRLMQPVVCTQWAVHVVAENIAAVVGRTILPSVHKKP